MPISDEKLKEVLSFYIENGEKETLETYSIKEDTLRRYISLGEKEGIKGEPRSKVIRDIMDNYTAEELKAIANGGRITPGYEKVPIISFEGQRIRVGHITDTHIGSLYFDENRLFQAFEEFRKEKVDFITHSGDVTEGMSNRPGHVYELSEIGYDRQKQKAVELFSQWGDTDIYAIDGNHDCLDEETELLTKRGWVKYFDIKEDDKILSYDIDGDYCDWDNIDKIIINNKEEDMVSIETNSFSFLGTKNHRFLSSKRGRDSTWKNYEYNKSCDITGRHKILNASYQKVSKYFYIQDEMLSLVGWMLTDGGIKRAKDNHVGSYTIYQSKNIDKIIKILNSLGFTYRIRTRNRCIKSICGVNLKNDALPQKEIIISYYGCKELKKILPNKKIPSWAYELTTRQFNILLESIIDGDGSRYNGKECSIIYGTYNFLSDLQSLCCTHGYRTSLKIDNRGAYRLNVSYKTTSSFECCQSKNVVSYDGITWCLSVPKTNFMVRRNGTTYFTGNCWFIKSNGAHMVKDISDYLDNFHFLGYSEGDISLKGKAIMKLWHGLDSSSYALSYRLQKVIESLSGGEKPDVLVTGHTHKYVSIFERNVHTLSVGSLQKQTPWMRGKRLAAHVGFAISDYWINNDGVAKVTNTWYPFYV